MWYIQRLDIILGKMLQREMRLEGDRLDVIIIVVFHQITSMILQKSSLLPQGIVLQITSLQDIMEP